MGHVIRTEENANRWKRRKRMFTWKEEIGAETWMISKDAASFFLRESGIGKPSTKQRKLETRRIKH